MLQAAETKGTPVFALFFDLFSDGYRREIRAKVGQKPDNTCRNCQGSREYGDLPHGKSPTLTGVRPDKNGLSGKIFGRF